LARKILLADDSVTAQNMGRKILTDAGYEVITVNNGSAALKRVGEQKPDLIVLDVYMPGYSGLEVCQRLKDSHETARIPILLTVGKLEPFKPEEARRVNADGFIVKPFEASELLSALTRLEDRIVPQGDAGRFSTGIERFSDSSSGYGFGRKAEPATDDTDSGWKNRLRFPSKKKTEEPEPEPEDFTVSTRNSRRGASKTRATSGPVPVPAAQEPTVVPDIPRDITPDELDALSALAAKLDSHAAGNAEKSADSKSASEAPPAEAVAAEAPAEIAPPPPPPPPAFEVKAEESPATFAAADLPEASVIEAPSTPAVESLAEIPVVAPVVEQTAPSQEMPVEAVAQSTDEAVSAQAIGDEKASQHEDQPQAETSIEPEHEIETASQAAAVVEAQVQEPPVAAEAAAMVEERPQDAAVPAAPASSEPEHVPTEEELAAALRLLTPSQAQSTASPATKVEEPVTVPADVVHALEQAGQSAGFVPRWMAESISLTPEEASVSLEAEMFQKFSMSSSAAVNTPASDAVPPAASAESAAAESQRVEEIPAPEATVAEGTANSQESAVEEPPTTTFADAIQQYAETREEVSAAPAESATPADVQSANTVEDEVGGEMGRDKSKAGWSSFHAIKPGAAPAPGNDPVQAAKDAAAEATNASSGDEAPKTMAAAAGADGDATAIASIVDSVLADLKPKIVEEIAKKLSKK